MHNKALLGGGGGCRPAGGLAVRQQRVGLSKEARFAFVSSWGLFACLNESFEALQLLFPSLHSTNPCHILA